MSPFCAGAYVAGYVIGLIELYHGIHEATSSYTWELRHCIHRVTSSYALGYVIVCMGATSSYSWGTRHRMYGSYVIVLGALLVLYPVITSSWRLITSTSLRVNLSYESYWFPASRYYSWHFVLWALCATRGKKLILISCWTLKRETCSFIPTWHLLLIYENLISLKLFLFCSI